MNNATEPPKPPERVQRPRHLRPPASLAVGAGMLCLLLVTTAFATQIAPYDASTSVAPSLQGFSSEHWMGTDEIGRDVLSRIIVGGQSTLLIVVLGVGGALIAGLTLGLVAGYFGGALDQVIMRVLDVAFAFPLFLLAITVVAALGNTIPNLVLTIAVVYTPALARVVRGPVLSVKNWEHVEAARSIGVSDSGILLKHILPIVASPILVETSLVLARAAITVTALAFLGLGPPPPDPNWGGMISAGRQFMELAPLNVIGPAVALFFATFTFILLSNGLRETLNVHS